MQQTSQKDNTVFSFLKSSLYEAAYSVVLFLIFLGDFIVSLFQSIINLIKRLIASIFKIVGIAYSTTQRILWSIIYSKKAKTTSVKTWMKRYKFLAEGEYRAEQKYHGYKAVDFYFPIKYAKKLITYLKNLIVFISTRKKKSYTKISVKKVTQKKQSKTIPSFGLWPKFKYFMFGLLVALVIATVVEAYYFVYNLPNPRSIGSVNYPVSTKIYDRKGRLLWEIYSQQQRTPIELSQIPDDLIKATIAIEDKEFYKHNGISLIGGVARASKEILVNKSLQGGSTITQQLVKSALLSPERTISRKLREMFLALWAERVFDKDQILSMYLNQVPYGGSSYGAEAASQNYFNKSASQLSLSEAAFLAGLPQAPTKYSPYTNPAGAKARRNDVLVNMLKLGYISDDQYMQALAEEINVVTPVQSIKAPHFVFYVRDLLVEKYGIRTVEEGGLRVLTTLDLDVQSDVQKIVSEEITNLSALNISNGAALVTLPSTGEIISMVGSVDYFQKPYGAYNVTVASRQPGSSIKPLMYSLALTNGFTAASIIDDAPVIFTSEGAPSYQPVNYDGRYHGKIPLRYALANSYNVPAVKVLNSMGVANFITHAKKLGITTWNEPERYGLSLTLGGAEVKMTDMAVAYGVFANGGKKTQLDPLLEVVDFRGNVFYRKQLNQSQELDPQVAYIISDILSDSFARRSAFGTNSKLEIKGFQVAVKTGTTNDMRDNWTIGYTPRFLTAVWVGNNDNSSMNRGLTSGITGAAPIFNRIMTNLLNSGSADNLQLANISDKFVKPEALVEKNCYFARKEYFVSGTENLTSCSGGFATISASPRLMPSAGVATQN